MRHLDLFVIETIMSPFELEHSCLSLRVWVNRCVIPATACLLLLLGWLGFFIDTEQYRDQNATIVGFFTLYFILVRGGHILMIRSMHFDMKRTYGEAYERRLSQLPRGLKQRNIGFTLARIKRDLINERQKRG